MVRGIGQELMTTTEVADLADVLARTLPDLGILGCSLALYEDPNAPGEWSRAVLVYDQEGRVDLGDGGRRFPSRQLVPNKVICTDGCHTTLVVALYFQEAQLGFILFEVDGPGDVDEGGTYEVLREQISSALRGSGCSATGR